MERSHRKESGFQPVLGTPIVGRESSDTNVFSWNTHAQGNHTASGYLLQHYPYSNGYQDTTAHAFSPFAEMMTGFQTDSGADKGHCQGNQADHQSRQRNGRAQQSKGNAHGKSVNAGSNRQPHEAPAPRGIEITRPIVGMEGLSDHIRTENHQENKRNPFAQIAGKGGQTFATEPAESRHHALKKPEVPCEPERVSGSEARKTGGNSSCDRERIRAESESSQEKSKWVHDSISVIRLKSFPHSISILRGEPNCNAGTNNTDRQS